MRHTGREHQSTWNAAWVHRLGIAARYVVLGALIATLGGCGQTASQAGVPPSPEPARQSRATAPAPIRFPQDEAPHDNLTEWWYYTGHLQTDDGQRYGFELVFFQTVRGDYPVLYFGQFAITDRARDMFQHVNRASQGSQIGKPEGFDLQLADWRMGGALGNDRLQASMEGYGIDLRLLSEKPAALHDEDGIVSFGPAGDSYYYSYTRMAVDGTLVDHGEPRAVHGQAWFDHQWGDFLVLGGGWDWFSLQLDDGADVMLNLLRDDQNQVVGVWGTYVDPAGAYRPLGQSDFSIRPTGTWTSPKSGAAYPMGWAVELRDPAYRLSLSPAVLDQELESAGQGPTYWEGDTDVEGTRGGQAVHGQAYVELTGYARR